MLLSRPKASALELAVKQQLNTSRPQLHKQTLIPVSSVETLPGLQGQVDLKRNKNVSAQLSPGMKAKEALRACLIPASNRPAPQSRRKLLSLTAARLPLGSV